LATTKIVSAEVMKKINVASGVAARDATPNIRVEHRTKALHRPTACEYSNHPSAYVNKTDPVPKAADQNLPANSDSPNKALADMISQYSIAGFWCLS
jgi:hypothetical protein